jgi:uncharacterized protein YxjI
MPINVACQCGKTYLLKDEFEGRLVRCPACQQPIRVQTTAPAAQADPIFDRDQFLLRQKHLSISQKYYVWDEHGEELLFVERPTHVLRSLGAICGTVFAVAVVAAIMTGVLVGMGPLPEPVAVVFGAFMILIGVVAGAGMLIWLSPKRHVHFYRDDSRREQVLQILQDQKFMLFVATYTVLDTDGAMLVRLRKNYLHNIIRKKWHCMTPDGEVICMAVEDSIILSLLRRLLGDLAVLLRTNFLIVTADQQHVLGEFNRKFTILDRYVLDLKDDPERTLDRRVALALGVMLDTGERR